MSIKRIYSCKDVRLDVFNQPMFCMGDEDAKRAFGALVTDPTSLVYKCAEDFALYCLGEYDDFTGVITKEEIPLLVDSAINIRRNFNSNYSKPELQ